MMNNISKRGLQRRLNALEDLLLGRLNALEDLSLGRLNVIEDLLPGLLLPLTVADVWKFAPFLDKFEGSALYGASFSGNVAYRIMKLRQDIRLEYKTLEEIVGKILLLSDEQAEKHYNLLMQERTKITVTRIPWSELKGEFKIAIRCKMSGDEWLKWLFC